MPSSCACVADTYPSRRRAPLALTSPTRRPAAPPSAPPTPGAAAARALPTRSSVAAAARTRASRRASSSSSGTWTRGRCSTAVAARRSSTRCGRGAPTWASTSGRRDSTGERGAILRSHGETRLANRACLGIQWDSVTRSDAVCTLRIVFLRTNRADSSTDVPCMLPTCYRRLPEVSTRPPTSAAPLRVLRSIESADRMLSSRSPDSRTASHAPIRRRAMHPTRVYVVFVGAKSMHDGRCRVRDVGIFEEQL